MINLQSVFYKIYNPVSESDKTNKDFFDTQAFLSFYVQLLCNEDMMSQISSQLSKGNRSAGYNTKVIHDDRFMISNIILSRN